MKSQPQGHKAQKHAFGVISSAGQREAQVGALLWFSVRRLGPDGLCSNSTPWLPGCVSLGKLLYLSGLQLPSRDTNVKQAIFN